MASSSGSAAAAVPATHKAFDILDLKAKVYDESVRLTEEDDKVVFHQPDILDMEFMSEVAALDKNESIKVLLDIVNKLLAEKLYKIVQDGEGMGWRVRSREEAKRFFPFTAHYNWNAN
jgi:DNA-directed RNA polymerase III subunit RPC6